MSQSQSAVFMPVRNVAMRVMPEALMRRSLAWAFDVDLDK